jgi:hypothetical protein
MQGMLGSIHTGTLHTNFVSFFINLHLFQKFVFKRITTTTKQLSLPLEGLFHAEHTEAGQLRLGSA